ncbi:hypothetical protein B0J13DRAFT_511863 [Dactylonectria estremocensis]|uniref:NmrA-like domain-containing protein n=1 Tax=Dactylonectria estremocensis TaxID=1079267 RepID=A0A9P9DR23_9HYPO|nr:hypothetical protein B0J13DRAFT_511863 [Dactylonectria estremocensis]
MSPHITVLPASTKAGKATISELLSSPSKPFVRAIYRDASKAPAEFVSHPNFEAVTGDVSVGSSLNFIGSDAVFYIPPPTFDGTDSGVFATHAANNVKKALQDATSVKKLLLFSSTGSQHDHGIGVLRINYISDTILKDAVAQVLIIRPGYFHEDWARAFQTPQAEPPLLHSPMTPIDHKIPMVSLIDVGEVCAHALLDNEEKASPYFFDLHGPRLYSTTDIKLALDEVTGKKWEIAAIPKDKLAEFWAEQVPAAYVQDFVEMTTAGLPGGIMDGGFEDNEHTVCGKVELVDALRKVYAA